MNPIESVCIVGAGYMGYQIGLQCASHGFPVRMYDISEEALDMAVESITNVLDEWTAEEEVTIGKKEAILGRIHTTEDMAEAVSGVDLVIEAIPERLELKREVFGELDRICGKRTILATNSSSIRISKIEGATSRPDRVLNTHFYSNPWRSSVVELMRGTATSDETLERVRGFMLAIGMVPLTVLRESTGFIFNRVWRAIKRECLHLADDGVATFEDVDRAWMCLYGRETGPFGMMDRIGLDVVLDIENVYYGESGDERDRPPRILVERVEKGELGVKTGKGFYTYPDPAFRVPSWLRAPGGTSQE
jgi:3-hydroxybutyryl-CoA dehydrogenase